MDLRNFRGVITGAGQGIGRKLAIEFAAQGAHLLLVGRTEGSLKDTARLVEEAGGGAETLVQDVSAPDAAERVASSVQSWDSVDLLVNNAGNVRAGRLDRSSAADLRAMVDLNLTAPILLTRELLPKLRSSAAGSRSLVLNISSEIALVAMPFYAVYAATKSGLASFGESLRRELQGTGVHVATVYPGATDTAMMTTQNADWERRPVADVVADVMAGLSAGDHEINATPQDSREMQQLNVSDPLAVDAAIAPELEGLEAAVRNHRSI